MSKRRRAGPSISEEPHLVADHRPAVDASEARADRVLASERRRPDSCAGVDHSVWEEPGLSPELVRQLTTDHEGYAGWLERGRQRTSAARSWGLTLLVALTAGAFGVLGIFLDGGQTVWSVLAIVVFGPVAEEMMKVALPLYMVERRPYLFRSRLQIALCGLASGLAFAAIENLLYLHVYVPAPPALLVQWRWSVCVALHMGCTMVNSLGLMRIWSDTWARRARPRLQLGFPYAVAAAVIHGAYNGLAMLLSLARYKF
jgi:hypothetical protein